ncbi:hypothetical protein AXG93_2278s1310 [Marchantia polymorpha subsp. ruderalis]|uniref:Uncharacterized protein n=1 Tax=Marchantia polymorpha subsp. ruderalis TaxID=1480154 RepID=A0A176WHJ2_MARPO|nr:hypothetical protein AXG93_2278s1310 [Marchantia polymorpha subsp. ruderalis]
MTTPASDIPAYARHLKTSSTCPVFPDTRSQSTRSVEPRGRGTPAKKLGKDTREHPRTSDTLYRWSSDNLGFPVDLARPRGRTTTVSPDPLSRNSGVTASKWANDGNRCRCRWTLEQLEPLKSSHGMADILAAEGGAIPNWNGSTDDESHGFLKHLRGGWKLDVV